MGWAKTMWNFITGRNQEINSEQEVVSRALAFQRERNVRLRNELTSEIQDLRGSEARMHDYFARLQVNVGRSKQGGAR